MRSDWIRCAGAAIGIGAGLMMSCCVMYAQDAAAGSKTSNRQMMAKDADPDWEVETVRPTDPNSARHGIVTHGRHVTVEGRTVEEMVVLGYGVQKSQIVNAPDWVSVDRFDIDGVSDTNGDPDVKQVQALLRKVLEERFGLKLHNEQRVMPVYALRLAKGGAKLTRSAADPNSQPQDYAARGMGASASGSRIRRCRTWY